MAKKRKPKSKKPSYFGKAVIATGLVAFLLGGSTGQDRPERQTTYYNQTLESEFRKAAAIPELRAEFVASLKNHIKFPDHVTDISYSSKPYEKDKQAFMATITNKEVIVGHESFTSEKSRIVVFPKTFARGTAITNSSDVRSMLEHEFYHADIFLDGGKPIARYCYFGGNQMEVSLYQVLHELEAYSKQLNEIAELGPDSKIITKKGVSERFVIGMMSNYLREFHKLKSMKDWDHLKEGVVEDLLKKYRWATPFHDFKTTYTDGRVLELKIE